MPFPLLGLIYLRLGGLTSGLTMRYLGIALGLAAGKPATALAKAILLNGTSKRTHHLTGIGLVTLIAPTVVADYGNYLDASASGH